jgi:hypothetical protein
MKNLMIKAIILIATMGIYSYDSLAQKAIVTLPQAVLTSFTAKYPQAQVKSWKMKGDISTASFAMDNKKYKAAFYDNGNWINTVRNIRHTSSLPNQVRLYLKGSRYASWHIDDMKRLRTPAQNMYEVEVDNNSGNKIAYEGGGSIEDQMLYFDDSGKLIKVAANN